MITEELIKSLMFKYEQLLCGCPEKLSGGNYMF